VKVPLVVVVASEPGTAVPLGSVTTTRMLAGLTALLNVARTVVVFVTRVAPFAGVIPDTVGAVSVVNDHTDGAIAVPSVLDAPAVAVYFVLAASTADGVNVVVVAVVVSVPGTATPEALTSVSVDLLWSTALVKVTLTGVLAATPVAPDAGDLLATTGAGDTVLNVQLYGVMAAPVELAALTVAV
jgi:hypothetical protein